MAALNAILPIFLLIMLGYGLCRFGVLTPDLAKGVSVVAFKLFLPCVLLTGLATARLDQGFSPGLLLAYFIPALGVFVCTSLYMHRRFGMATSLGLCACFSNNVLIGLPLVATLFGDQGLIYTFSVLAFHSLLLFTFQSLYTSFAGAEAFSMKGFLTNLANPLIVGILIGITINVSGISLPGAVDHVLHWMADAALPCALIVLGANLSTFRLMPSRLAVGLTVVKLVLMPAAVLLVSVLVGLNPLARAVLIVMAANPAGVNVLAFARTPGDVKISSSTILVSTAFSIVTLPLWMAIASAI
ncbi:AEC family transporter [Pseudomonas matsuisoli]|uniref:Membrane protein n=1 Tax=Pseudomonas matsuisoli TaxID=1515666 RepID=A0A917PLG4_9PSED|nr:AEC family transporter [Pseudomonas matsuisoli]GGJ83939.1 membrane protein [Pseudomonas matsuisoli]